MVAGALSAAGSLYVAQAYVEATRTLTGLSMQVHEAARSAGEVVVGLELSNGGPWPVEVLELQVLAWQGPRYVGLATADWRAQPLDLAPGARRRVRLAVPTLTAGGAPDAASAGRQAPEPWRLRISGRIHLARMGPRPFQQTVTFDEPGSRP